MLGRALVIAVVGVVLGVLALQAGQHNAPAATGATTTTTGSGATTTTTAPKTTTTTAPVSAPSTSIKVEVTNASKITRVAAYYTGVLSSAGWGTVTPQSATTQTPTSAVYYASGQQGAGNGVAKSLGLATTAVQPIGATTPVSHPTPAAAVVVVIGTDLATKVPASTT